MPFSILLKPTLLVSATFLVHNGTLSPTPPPRPDAVARFTKRDTIAGIVNWVPTINMAILWSAALAEVAVIVADYRSSNTVLSLLSLGSPSLACNPSVSPWFLVGCGLSTFGAGLRILCFRHLGRQFTYNLSIIDGHKLITDGPYSIVRHPSYTGWIALTVGSILMHFAPGSWALECGPLRFLQGRIFAGLYTLYNAYIIAMLFPRMKREDDVLKAQFGDEWVEWTKRTRYRIIPSIY